MKRFPRRPQRSACSRSLLSRGSFATDYAGTWHTPVAVKVLHPLLVQGGFDGRREFLRQFGNECNRLRKLRHERVVQFLRVTRFHYGLPAMVTERLNTTLHESWPLWRAEWRFTNSLHAACRTFFSWFPFPSFSFPHSDLYLHVLLDSYIGVPVIFSTYRYALTS